jgi:hypothetical protein
MPSEDFNWNKTRAQCPYCGGWFTRQGINGHIRFRHPDRKKDDYDTTVDLVWATEYVKAAQIFTRDGRLPPELRERLFDLFLLDYLGKLARSKL